MGVDVAAWLDALGLPQYVELFAANAIDREVLPDLTDDELKELGLPLGHRKKLIKAIAELNGSAASVTSRPNISAVISHRCPSSMCRRWGICKCASALPPGWWWSPPPRKVRWARP